MHYRDVRPAACVPCCDSNQLADTMHVKLTPLQTILQLMLIHLAVVCVCVPFYVGALLPLVEAARYFRAAVALRKAEAQAVGYTQEQFTSIIRCYLQV
jgi:hypothetical protein